MTAEALERLAALARDAVDYAAATGEPMLAASLELARSAAMSLAHRERSEMTCEVA